MQKITNALTRLTQALERLEAQQQKLIDEKASHAALEIEAAHLRSDVSSLKKHKQDLQSKQKKAAQEVDKAMG